MGCGASKSVAIISSEGVRSQSPEELCLQNSHSEVLGTDCQQSATFRRPSAPSAKGAGKTSDHSCPKEMGAAQDDESQSNLSWHGLEVSIACTPGREQAQDKRGDDVFEKLDEGVEQETDSSPRIHSHCRTTDSGSERSKELTPSHTQSLNNCTLPASESVFQVHTTFSAAVSVSDLDKGERTLESVNAKRPLSNSHQQLLDRNICRPNIPRDGHSTEEPASLVANSQDESVCTHTNQDTCRPAGLVEYVVEQATSRCSSPSHSDASDVEMCSDQLIAPKSASIQALAKQNCYSLSKNFKIQTMQFKLGFIWAVTAEPN